MPRTIKPRDGRLSIRIDPARKAVIARAAKQHGESISEFVVDHAYQLARTLLADEGKLNLTKSQVAEIFATLDNPPAKSVAALRKLLVTKTVLDG